jgi:hypothetical protein
MLRRHRSKQTISLEVRLAKQAQDYREQADKLPPGDEREALLMKARRADLAVHISKWASSPGLQSPR